jgi:GntR family transcriptional regulator
MIKIDATSYMPFYEQVKTEIRKLIMTGSFRGGEALPSIRELAAELVLNPNTVARAYRELEQEGLIVTQKGKGSYVADGTSPVVRKTKEAHLHKIFDRAIKEARDFDLDLKEILGIFESRLEKTGGDAGKGGRHE